jgi:hypothetical protein
MSGVIAVGLICAMVTPVLLNLLLFDPIGFTILVLVVVLVVWFFRAKVDLSGAPFFRIPPGMLSFYRESQSRVVRSSYRYRMKEKRSDGTISPGYPGVVSHCLVKQSDCSID